MLGIERISKVGRLLVQFDRWAVHEMVLTKEKFDWLWEESRQYPSLYSSLDDHWKLSLAHKVTEPRSLWYEVYEPDRLIGLIYINDISVINAEFHVYFFDRKVKEKVPLCREMIRYLFQTYHFHRLSMDVPAIYHATIRMAKSIGFRPEGKRRSWGLLGGKWVDYMMFGLLAEEMD